MCVELETRKVPYLEPLVPESGVRFFFFVFMIIGAVEVKKKRWNGLIKMVWYCFIIEHRTFDMLVLEIPYVVLYIHAL